MRDHFIIMKKLMKKKIKNALIVRSYFEQKWISPVIEIMYMKKSKSTSVITVKKSFQKEAISKGKNITRKMHVLSFVAVVRILYLPFCGQYFQKYHPLGFSKYCVNMKTSCIRQNFKYIDYFRKIH